MNAAGRSAWLLIGTSCAVAVGMCAWVLFGGVGWVDRRGVEVVLLAYVVLVGAAWPLAKASAGSGLRRMGIAMVAGAGMLFWTGIPAGVAWIFKMFGDFGMD